MAVGNVAAEDRSPFAPAAAADVSVAVPAASPLDRFEFSGVTCVGDVVQVCLVEQPAQRGRWLTVGRTEDGLLAARYDAERAAVLVQSEGSERWIALRRGAVVVLAVVRKDDGTIDYGHMALTDREKEKKAAIQHWEFMEITRQARRDSTVPDSGRSPPANAAPPLSPVR